MDVTKSVVECCSSDSSSESTSETPDSEQPKNSEQRKVASLLDKLKPAKLSDIARERKR